MGSREYVDEKLGTFLDYVKTGKAEDEFTHNLEESVKTFNENEEWRNKFVTLEMKFEQKYEQGYEEGIAETVIKALKNNHTPEEIAEFIDLELDTVLKIQNEYMVK